MLSYGYWQRRFGGDPDVVGRTISVDSQPRADCRCDAARIQDRELRLRSAGTAGLRSRQPVSGWLWLSRHRAASTGHVYRASQRGCGSPAQCLDGLVDERSRVRSALVSELEDHPRTAAAERCVVGSIGNVLWVVMGTIGVVMLIACTNVANLLLVRADARQQELQVRAALGAGRWRVARELLLESLTLGLLGGAAGLVVAWAGLRLLTAIGPSNLPRLSEISLDARSVVFTLMLSRAFRIVVRLHSGVALCLFAPGRALARSDANIERQPGAAARTQPAGRRTGSHGAGAAHQRGAHDPHLRGDAAKSIPDSPVPNRSRSCASRFPRIWSKIQ